MEVDPPNWLPLELRIGARCADFMWMFRQNGIERYKHLVTRQYLMLDSQGQCYAEREGQLVVADFGDQLSRVTEAYVDRDQI